MLEAVEFERRFQAAIKELEAAGVKPVAANPPMTRAARTLGLRVKPPFYMDFQQLSCFMGLPFGVFWGVFMYFGFWKSADMPMSAVLGSSVIAAVFFGCGMAWFINGRRKLLSFRPWDEL